VKRQKKKKGPLGILITVLKSSDFFRYSFVSGSSSPRRGLLSRSISLPHSLLLFSLSSFLSPRQLPHSFPPPLLLAHGLPLFFSSLTPGFDLEILFLLFFGFVYSYFSLKSLELLGISF
jgi:hypothetical protein